MKKKHLVSIVILVILVIIVMVLSVQIYYKNIQSHKVLSEVGFRNIVFNINQLEGAIKFQMDTNWNEPNNVIEKVEDVIEGIYLTQKIGNELKILSNEDEMLLERLHRFLRKFPEHSGFPNHEIAENEIELFEELRRNLRDIGWGYNINYSNSWGELLEKANNLMSK